MRAAARREQAGVALFPFLAVLICTMGALIVLLVLLVQQARVDAKTVAQARTRDATFATGEKEQLEDQQWRRELLEQSHKAKTQELADSRDKLAHLEEHIQRLEAQAQALLERCRAIDEGRQLKGSALDAARAELARLQNEIDAKKRSLEAARQQQSSEQWYALIPYAGASGTRRRPIYLECTELGVVIQPEGLLLGDADFDGPRGPGNPLDAAVRTVREHLQKTAGAKAGDAYPLLVVRPGGVQAYSAARDALQAWDDEFGYELIGDDKRLDFGPSDPALAARLKSSVTAARQRQAALAAMMPRRYHSEEAATAGSPEPGTMVGGSPGNAAGRGVGIGAGGSGTGQRGATGSGLGDPLAQGAAQLPRGTNEGGTPTRSASEGDMTTRSVSEGGPLARSASEGGPRGAAGQSNPGGSTANTGQSAGGYAGAAAPGASKLQFGSPRPGSTYGAPQSSSAANAARGNNWGLPGSRGRTTAITRPLHIVVLADRLVLVPERGENRPPQHLPIAPELSPADVERFVTAVQTEIKGWGLAVADGYWKPVLQIEVAPGAERHFSKLQSALAGSGFEIERESP
jgi:hypothetical protein